MIFKTIRGGYLLLILFLISSSVCLAQKEYLPYPGVIHVHSYVSAGKEAYPLRKIVSLAQDKGIKILVFTDTFLSRWEYGLPIFSNIFKVSMEEDSVVKYGIKNYLRDLEKIKKVFPDIVILEGIEVTPFYWWSGSPFKKNLSLNDHNKHLLVIGLKKYQDYVHLPIVYNRYFLPQFKDIPALLIPVALFILGTLLLKKRKPRKFLGLILNAVGILFLFNLFPFSASRYNPYHGQVHYLPYQDLINYVNKKGGLVFWAHPEVTEQTSSGKFVTINFSTPSYPEALMLTCGYTGFGIGTNYKIILPGGEWDDALIDYCRGKRTQPTWAIGELDYRRPGQIGGGIQNIFFYQNLKKSLYIQLLEGESSIYAIIQILL